jgi:hypothetical protein
MVSVGGKEYTGTTECCSGATFQYGNDYYSQCLPVPESSTSSTKKPNDDRFDGVTTRYWDCCKASCAWNGKESVTNPVRTCEKDGVTPIDVNAQSGCGGGPAFMCTNQQPWNVSDTLSYGSIRTKKRMNKSDDNWRILILINKIRIKIQI